MDDGGRKESRRTGHASAIGSARKSRQGFQDLVREVELGELKAGKLRLYAPTRFVRDWVSRHYGDRVLAYWQSVNTRLSSVEVNLVPPPAPRRPTTSSPCRRARAARQLPATDAAARSVDRPRREECFTAPSALHLRQLRGRQANEFAYAAARNIAGKIGRCPSATRSTFSARGLGKTHLMHAIWHVIANAIPSNACSTHGRGFVNRFIQALRTKNTNQFQGVVPQCRRPDGRRRAIHLRQEATQDEFFFTFNSLVEQNKQIVLSSEKPPSELQTSRSACGPGWVRSGRRHPFLDLRTAALHPADQGGGCAAFPCAGGARVPGPQDQLQHRDSKARSTGWSPTAS